MNLSTKSAARRARPELALGLSLCLLLAVAGSAAGEDVWPRPALERPPESLGGAELADFRYAAGLYRSLLRDLGAGNPRLLPPADAERLARAELALGDGDDARRRVGGRDDLPAELLLQLALADPEADWSDLERERWRALTRGEDGESLYWSARLALVEQDDAAARARLSLLLRREPGSIFAPAALELLQGLPSAQAPEAGEPVDAPALVDGPRVQWGVFGDARGARRLRDAVAAYGEQAQLLRLRRDGAELYRVCSRPFATEAEARALGALYRERYGLDFVLYRPPAEGSAP